MTTTQHDPLTTAEPDRVSYSTGTLLDAADFEAEQTYHRGRLAAALANIAGSGTLAGLRVRWASAVEASEESAGSEEELRVEAGLALDPRGRIIEVTRPACIRLQRWFDQQVDENPDEVTQGHRGDPYNGVVIDLFIRFAVCPREKTPAFKSGPYDALDAVVPSRLRDAYELKLVIRTDELTAENPKLPTSKWPTPASHADGTSRLLAVHEAILSVPEATGEREAHVPVTEDANSVFLARLVIPATQAVPNTDTALGSLPVRTADPVRLDNFSRRFVYPTAALASWLGHEDRARDQPDST